MKQTLQFRILSLQVIKRSLVILCMALFANSMSIHAQTINLPLIRDAFRNDAFDPGLAVPTPIMETNYVSEDFSAVTNYVGTSIPPTYNENLAQAALKFRLPRSGSVLSRAKLFFRVMDIQGSPTATVTLTDDNGWEQNSIPGLSTFPTLSNASVLLTNAPVSSRGWFSLYLPTSALGAKIVPTGATDATLIISGSTVPNTYFNFVADDDASGDKAYLRITFKPQVQSVSVPANNTYKIGDALNFTVSFDSLINVTGTPKLPITLNTGGTVQASYLAGSGSQNLVFRYTVASGDLDMDGVTVGSAIELNGGTISSDFGEDAELNLYYVGATTGVLVNGILPAISSVSPTSGPIAGGTSVTITGTGFTGATAVKFGSTNATSFAVNSSTQITAVSPAGSAGATDITITTPNGTSTTNINDKFTYVAAPTVITNAATSITSAGATLNGSINAKNASTTVTFEYGLTTSYGTIVTADQSPVTGGTATPVSKTITGLTAGTTYHYRVNGVNVGGTTNGTDLTFTTVATAPTESFYDQITLPFAPTDDVDMSSSTLAPSMYLASASTVKSYPSKGYKVTLPKSGTITLSASSNEIATNEFAFLVSTSYDASSSSKKYMAAGNGTTTTLTPGAYYIVLFTDNKYGKFRVNITFKALPNITSISPANGPIAGGTSVVITGINFTGTTAVKFGTTAATSYTVNSDTQIIATAPTGTGTVDVRVTTADGTSATSSADRFTYVAAPTITAISPTSGSTAGSTSVVITGTNLTAATAVKFGSANATNFTVNSATQITATAPARSPGVVDITVTTAGGTSATSTSDQFTYVSAPTVTTNAATSINSTEATLNGSVNANNASTAVTFEYGLTTSYGTSVAAAQSPVTGTSATAVSSAITGLTPNTTYHYRVVGVNAEGTTNGADQSFTVQSTPQTISFGALDTKTYGDSPYDLTATSTSGLAVSYSSDNTTVATVSGTTVTIVGTGTANITASQVGNATNLAAANVIQQLTVNKKALSVTATADTKTYNGTTVSTAIPTVGTLATGDAINVAPTQVFDNASIGTTHVLTATGLTIKRGSTDVTGNYDISYTTATGTINKLAVTVTATADTKTYDGTTVSTAVPTVGTLSTGDAINVVPTQAFDNAVVGTAHVLTASGLTIKNGTTDVTGNYDISYAQATGTINKLGVTVTAVADTKTYDGTTISTAVPTVGALAIGDAINLAPTQTFNNATVGTTTHVLTASGLTIKKGSADVTGNYDISYVSANGNITPKSLTITAPTITLSKVYDGNNVATLTVGTLSGVVASDAGKVTVTAVASYDNATVGTNKAITVVYRLVGSAAGNYSAPADLVVTGAEISSGSIVLEPLSNPTPSATNNDLVLSYNVVAGGPTQYKITFEAAALAVGMQNVSYTVLATTGADGRITISVPKGTRPGKYKGTLQLKNDSGVESAAYDFVITVNIPTEYIAVKYNRVLVLDNSTRMFSAYQWYKDGVAIDGATKQFYSDPKGLVGTYSIQATTTDGEILYSYPKVLNIPLIKKVTAYPTMVRANQTCTVEITDEAMELDLKGAELYVYSSQGTRVYYSTKVEKLNTIKLPTIDGTYSGRVTTADGQSFLFKIIVAN
jgi:predicted secreted protein